MVFSTFAVVLGWIWTVFGLYVAFALFSYMSRLGSRRYPISDMIVARPGIEPKPLALQAKNLTTIPRPLSCGFGEDLLMYPSGTYFVQSGIHSSKRGRGVRPKRINELERGYFIHVLA